MWSRTAAPLQGRTVVSCGLPARPNWPRIPHTRPAATKHGHPAVSNGVVTALRRSSAHNFLVDRQRGVSGTCSLDSRTSRGGDRARHGPCTSAPRRSPQSGSRRTERAGWQHLLSCLCRSAEGVGFEPTRTRQRPSGFQDRRHRPLGEPSRCRVQPLTPRNRRRRARFAPRAPRRPATVRTWRECRPRTAGQVGPGSVTRSQSRGGDTRDDRHG
jgi:hypothetical protein